MIIFDYPNSAVEFRKCLETLEDPKTENQLDGSEDPLQDLEVRLE